MNHFDVVARQWDQNTERFGRSEAVAKKIIASLPLNNRMKVLEYGAGTGILSFVLKDEFSEIVMMDSSNEMVNVMKEKVAAADLNHLKPVYFNLEESAYNGDSFDMIYNLLVMHHVQNIDLVLKGFYEMLKPGGYIVLIDLYSEDGSFHKSDFSGHNGFNPDVLGTKLKSLGFNSIEHKQCHIINRENNKGEEQEYPLFILIAKRD